MSAYTARGCIAFSGIGEEWRTEPYGWVALEQDGRRTVLWQQDDLGEENPAVGVLAFEVDFDGDPDAELSVLGEVDEFDYDYPGAALAEPGRRVPIRPGGTVRIDGRDGHVEVTLVLVPR
ncbi:hypothetical protein [Kitasatospora sp. NPDC093806]|uniref:hypothetical protein n=1 Tax=Kitasatospora sp. NPDC093806 TaxID=3155075 RepID=UPI00343D714D